MAQATQRSTPLVFARHSGIPERRPRTLLLAVPLILTVVALGLRLYQIGNEPLWLDEGYTLLFSRLGFPQLFLVGGAHEHPPLYYLIVHTVLAVRNDYLVPRVISALAGALSVWVIYLLGRQLFNRLGALVAATLCAVAPFQVWYSQDGRGYELAGLFVLLSYYCLFRALSVRRQSSFVLYAVCTAAALYTEYTTVLVLLPQALAMFEARREGQARRLAFSWLGATVAFLPWMGMLTLDAAGIAGDYWIPSPTPTAVSSTVLEFFGLITPCQSPPCTGHEIALPALAGNEVPLALMVAAFAVGLAGYAAWRRNVRLGMLTAWLILPFVVILLLALRRSLYLDRVFLDATFALFLLLGWGASKLMAPFHPNADATSWPAAAKGRSRIAHAVAVFAIVVSLAIGAVSLVQLQPIYAGGVNPDWKTAARDFAAAYRPGQAVVFNPGVLRTLVGSYLPAGWQATRDVPLWSRSYLDVPGWQSRYPQPLDPTKAQRQQIEALLRNLQLAQAARGEREVWLVTYDYSGLNDSRRWYTEHGFELLLSEIYDGDTRIELWSRSGPASFGIPVLSPRSFPGGWNRIGHVRITPSGVEVKGHATLTRAFPVEPGAAYSASIQFLGVPPASKPLIETTVYDRRGHLLGTFPRTKWYDWPVNDVWLAQPFGFVAPPGAYRAVITLSTGWGQAYWRDIGVYRER